MNRSAIFDIFIVGGGVNGCWIARDAVARGLSVALAEQGDLGQSASLIPEEVSRGDMRHLERLGFRQMHEALTDRAATTPFAGQAESIQVFRLPHLPKSRRRIRLSMNTPRKHLTKEQYATGLQRWGGAFRGRNGNETAQLLGRFSMQAGKRADWIEDSKLAALNARIAADYGAEILTHTRVVETRRRKDYWLITIESDAGRHTCAARALINATGPWLEQFMRDVAVVPSHNRVRFVRSFHIVIDRSLDHAFCYRRRGGDGRVVFAVPYEGDFTLIGTTEENHAADPDATSLSDAEKDHLLEFASRHFNTPVQRADIVWSCASVRPIQTGKTAPAKPAKHGEFLSFDANGAPILSVSGGGHLAYRHFADAALLNLAPYFPHARHDWAEDLPLPRRHLRARAVPRALAKLKGDYPFLTDMWAHRLLRAYGADCNLVLGPAKSIDDLGEDFGATLTAREVDWLVRNEFARSAEDIVWRRTKLGLRMAPNQIERLQDYLDNGRGHPIRDQAVPQDPDWSSCIVTALHRRGEHLEIKDSHQSPQRALQHGS